MKKTPHQKILDDAKILAQKNAFQPALDMLKEELQTIQWLTNSINKRRRQHGAIKLPATPAEQIELQKLREEAQTIRTLAKQIKTAKKHHTQ